MTLTRSFPCPGLANAYRDELEAKGYRGVVVLATDDGAYIVSAAPPRVYSGLIVTGNAIAAAVAMAIGSAGFLAGWVATP